jgi:hypothetical protein
MSQLCFTIGTSENKELQVFYNKGLEVEQRKNNNYLEGTQGSQRSLRGRQMSMS